MFDMENNDKFTIRGIHGKDQYAGVLFKVGTWKKRVEYKIEVEMEYDLIEGKLTGNLYQ
jgi:hypothetical protein